jgi:hypothetical protein
VVEFLGFIQYYGMLIVDGVCIPESYVFLLFSNNSLVLPCSASYSGTHIIIDFDLQSSNMCIALVILG